jgi:hypothetical protein
LDNKDKIILDLCGGTGAWSKLYKDAGYDVRLITLPLFKKVPSISDFTGSGQTIKRAITPPGFAKAFFKVNK